MAHTWKLTCLLCGARPEQCDEYQRKLHGDLVALQHHAMLDHSIGHHEFQESLRYPPHGDGDQAAEYTWELPDGRVWLKAVRVEEVVPAG